ncbi:hypothetical protein B0T18DRAFT_145212 [Schizothecium vesticola]|uniref:Uncharacterized protein n=1 Tax=Schizothecium vesticola TaxID=314040 RepID=A0AA40K512_9PEZI|nr:hypothetical protein B0T18DRAFT_145212 [Schizothecium vesticola]
MLKTGRRDDPKHSLLFLRARSWNKCLISVRTIGEDVLGVARRSPADLSFFWWPSQPGSIFRRPSPSPFSRPTPTGRYLHDPIHRVSRAFGQGEGESASDAASASRHGSDLSTTPTREREKTPKLAGNGDSVLQVPSALNKRPPPRCLLSLGPFQDSGSQGPSSICSCSRGHRKLVVCSSSPPCTRPPAENGKGLSQGMLPSLIHH